MAESSSLLGNIKDKIMSLIPTNRSTENNKSTPVNTERIGTTINAIKNTVVGERNMLATNYVLIVCIVIVCLCILILYFFSNSFRTSMTLDSISMYYQFQTLSSYPISSNATKVTLADCQFSSAANPALVKYQMLDYENELVVKAILKAGVRFLEFNIFNSEFGPAAIPVVSNGYKVGEWKLTLNMLAFDLICSTIHANAFTTGGDNGVPNPDDPLFISLNLNTNNNLFCLDQVADIILKYFRRRLPNSKYTYQQRNIALAPMSDISGKVILFASDGFQGSKLEELINGSWNQSGDPLNGSRISLPGVNAPNIRHVHYSELMVPSLDVSAWVNFNKTGITIVVPNQEGDFWSSNYDPSIAWKCGCQFVAMNWQVVDKPMDNYVSTFKNYSITVKPKEMRA